MRVHTCAHPVLKFAGVTPSLGLAGYCDEGLKRTVSTRRPYLSARLGALGTVRFLGHLNGDLMSCSLRHPSALGATRHRVGRCHQRRTKIPLAPDQPRNGGTG